MGIISDIFGTASKNPSVVALAALGIGLFIFRDKISGFFSDITGGAQGTAQIAETGGILAQNLTSNLTGIQDILSGKLFEGLKLPEIQFPEFKFPEIKLPEFKFPEIKLPEFKFPEFPSVGTQDITETPAAIGRASQRGRVMDVIKAVIPEMAILDQVQTQIPDQQFFGGGPSFIGGTVSEIPLERQSLGDIISNLGVTASQAASLRAEAIGFNPQEESFLTRGQELSPLGDLGPQVSDPAFQGLSIEEIALRLTGGNISNF